MSSTITGTILKPNGALNIGVAVDFFPQNTPFVLNDAVVSTEKQSATTNGSGVLSIVLVAGLYRVVIPDTEPFFITVPSTDGTYDITTVITDAGVSSTKTALDVLNITSIEQLESVLGTTRSILYNRYADPDGDSLRIAIVGNTGAANSNVTAVNALVESVIAPDEVILLGNQNFGTNNFSTLDDNCGYYWKEFIYPYTGSYGGTGSADLTNHLWPAPGQYDWGNALPGSLAPYLSFFTLPTNGNGERYYKVTLGNCELFVVDSDQNEADGFSNSSVQALWLQSALAASTARFRLVAFSDALISSASGYTRTWMNTWPLAAWGASAVIMAGAAHYERFNLNGIPLFVVGTGGGKALDTLGTVQGGSEVRVFGSFGAMSLDVSAYAMTFSFYNTAGASLDTFTVYPPKTLSIYASVRLLKDGGIKCGADGLYLDESVFLNSRFMQLDALNNLGAGFSMSFGAKTFNFSDVDDVNTVWRKTDVTTYVAAQRGAINGLASLDGAGLIPTSQLPALAITVPSVVASQAAMLALTAEQGDVAIRTDISKTFILATNSPTTLADWKEILFTVYGDANVLACLLTGYAVGANTALAATDSILAAFQKVQGQLNAKLNLSGGTLTGPLLFSGGTITANAPLLDLSQTWNNAAVTFTALKLNITDTASNAASLLMDLQVGGVSQFRVDKSGNIHKQSGNFQISCPGANRLYLGTSVFGGQLTVGPTDATMGSAVVLGWSSDTTSYGTVDLKLVRAAANTLAQRNGTNAQTFQLFNTYTDASNGRWWEIGAQSIKWTGNGTGVNTTSAYLINNMNAALIFQTNATDRWQISASGHFLAGTDNAYDIGASGATRPRNGYFAGALIAGGSSVITWTGKTTLSSPSDGILLLRNDAGNDFNRFQLGGTTSSFPAFKRSTTGLIARLADDSADTWFEASQFRVGGSTSSFPMFVNASAIMECKLADNSAYAILKAMQLRTEVAALTYAGTVTIDLNAAGEQEISATGNLTLATSNRAAGRNVTLRVEAVGVTVNMTYPAWRDFGVALPASIASGEAIYITLRCRGTADTDIDVVSIEEV